jgi:hypothetical protein
MLFSPWISSATIYHLLTTLVMYLYIYFCNWICFFAYIPASCTWGSTKPRAPLCRALSYCHQPMLLTNFIAIWLYLLCATFVHAIHAHRPSQQVLETIENATRKVPVILGVMSQCPDALYCEAVFDRVLEHVGDIVDLQLSFIGR